jgi:tetratricopeptide (TPR) repeat protein
MLGNAYAMNGDFDKALVVVRKAFDISTEIRFLLGVGWSKQVLGDIARAKGDMAEAKRDFSEAIEAFQAIGARFELARTHFELAKLARMRGDAEVLRDQLLHAYQLFSDLNATKYVERTSQLGEQMGLSLSSEPMTGAAGL